LLCGIAAWAAGLLGQAHMSEADDLQARTDAFADLSIKFVQGLPETPLTRRIAGQFQDAATSVGANYRAARRAKSHADRKPAQRSRTTRQDLRRRSSHGETTARDEDETMNVYR
jgi:hypothetical protein